MRQALLHYLMKEVAGAGSLGPFSLSSRFLEAAKNESVWAEADRTTLHCIAQICSYSFQPREKFPFGPMIQWANHRSALPQDLSDAELDDLKELSGLELPACLQALICDVLWLRRRDHKAARRAIWVYLDCAEGFDVEGWTTAIDFAWRATVIANELGKKAIERKAVREKLQDWLNKSANSPALDQGRHWPHALAELMLAQCDDIDLSALGEKLSTLGEVMPDSWTRADYYELAAKAFGMTGDSPRLQTVYSKAGASWLQDAERMQKSENESSMLVADRLQRAIECYRKAGKTERAEQLIRELQLANKRAIEEMATIHTEVDISDLVKRIRERMKNKVGIDAIKAFLRLYKSPNCSEAIEEVRKSMSDFPLQHLMGSHQLNEEGNIAAKTSGAVDDGEAEFHRSLVDHYSIERGIPAAMLDVARECVFSDGERHWEQVLHSLIQSVDLIDDSRKDMVNRALVAGFSGDYVVFTHLIVPQIESCLRAVVRRAGGKTTTMKNGIMKEIDINGILTNNESGRNHVEAIIGIDLIWDLRTLLVEQSGPNLRNRLCHGLAGSEELAGSNSAYLLWLTLYLFVTIAQKSQSSN